LAKPQVFAVSDESRSLYSVCALTEQEGSRIGATLFALLFALLDASQVYNWANQFFSHIRRRDFHENAYCNAFPARGFFAVNGVCFGDCYVWFAGLLFGGAGS
jgi:hypothetical protein